MAYLGILLAAIAGLSIWMWRARAAADATKGVLDAADDVRAAIRRFGYKRKQGHPLDGIDDSRLAAAGMMAATARLDGDYTQNQIDRIKRECIETFEVDSAEANDMVAYGRWLAQQGEPEEVMRRLTRGMRSGVTQDQKDSLFAMLERVAAVEGSVSETQSSAFEVVRRTFG